MDRVWFNLLGATILISGGGGVEFFLINNFGRTLREIDKFTSRTVLYKRVIECEIFSAPPSPVEINNFPSTKTPAPPPLDIEWWPSYSAIALDPRLCHTFTIIDICHRYFGYVTDT